MFLFRAKDGVRDERRGEGGGSFKVVLTRGPLPL